MFIVKAILAGMIIVLASNLAQKNPVLAGFIIALPLMSILSIFFTYLQNRDMNKVNEFAVSIFLAVPLSLTFFIPFLLNKWLKLNFGTTFGLGFVFLFIAYITHQIIFKIVGIR